MGTRTYRVTVDIRRDDVLGDRAHVTVSGHTYRYPWHWEDNVRSLARRVVEDNYRAETFGPVAQDRNGTLLVTAQVW
jgi:hypothetical protein